jgi:tRNA (cytidine/uridine-2'-O-)-methyltransferase
MADKPALALYQPDIAGNTGTLIRLSACMGTKLHIIEPAGFRTDDTNLKRAGMDYVDLATIVRHNDFDHFLQYAKANRSRVILMTTKSTAPYADFKFRPSDILLMGRESSGVPENVHQIVDASLTIKMQNGARSLNQAISAAMVLGEALRQEIHQLN